MAQPPLSDKKQQNYRDQRQANGPSIKPKRQIQNEPLDDEEQQQQQEQAVPSQLAPLDFEKIKLDSFMLIIGEDF